MNISTLRVSPKALILLACLAAAFARAETDLTKYLSGDGKRLALIAVPVEEADFRQLSKPAFQHVETAFIRSTNFTDAAALNLKGLPIHSLTFSETRLTEAGFAVLKELPLRSLTLARQRITGKALMQLSDKPLPDGLLLTASDFRDEDLLMLTGFDDVPLLNLARTKVTENGLLKFRAFKNLKSLYLYQIKISPEAVNQLKQSRPGLKVETKF